MRLATFSTAGDAVPRLGAAAAGGLLDATGALGFASLKSLLAEGPASLDRLRKLVRAAESGDADARKHVVGLDQVTFQPPILDPGKFLCVGKNYREHLDELVRTALIKEIPQEPTAFVKLNSVLVGYGAEVERPDGIVQFDYEPELAFVIGKGGYRISQADAMQHVAGITLFNDLTAREIQKREVESGTRFWTAKNMPGFGPVGPYVVTLDEVADVDDIWIDCMVNGEARMRFNTSGQINKIPRIIEHFSRFIPLEPGDMFATGSAGGVAVAQPNAAELFLKPGDECVIGMERVMTLRTRIV